eukprot:PhM_4_TR14097/c0_g1_i2/m.49843
MVRYMLLPIVRQSVSQYHRLLRDDDEEHIMFRKFFVLFLASLTPHSIIWIVYCVYCGIQKNDNASLVVAAGSAIASTIFMCNYVHVRRTRRAPDAVVHSQFLGLWQMLALMFLAAPEAPVEIFALSIFMAMVLSNGTLKVSSVLSTAIILVSVLSRLLNGGTGPTSYFHKDVDFAVRVMIEYVYCLGGIVIAIVSLFWSRAFEKKADQVRAAVVMAVTLTEHLERYDTQAAINIIERYRTDGIVDTHLLDRFELIVMHLDSYRPYIPHYVLRDDATPMLRSGRSDPSAFSENAVTSESDSTHSPRNRNPLEFVNLASVGMGPGPPPVVEIHSITAAVLDISPTLRTAASVGSDADSSSAVHEAVDFLFHTAESASGTIHGIFGDHVHVTWNVTRSVRHHESVAIGFLRQCQDVGRGVACSGTARCQSAGSIQSVIAMYMPWQPMLHEMLRLARLYDIVVVSASAFSAAHVHFEGRAIHSFSPVGMEDSASSSGVLQGLSQSLSLSMSLSSRRNQSLVYEITSERLEMGSGAWQERQASDWTVVDERASNEAVTDAVRCVMLGKYDEAAQAIVKVSRRAIEGSAAVGQVNRWVTQKNFVPLSTT